MAILIAATPRMALAAELPLFHLGRGPALDNSQEQAAALVREMEGKPKMNLEIGWDPMLPSLPFLVLQVRPNPGANETRTESFAQKNNDCLTSVTQQSALPYSDNGLCGTVNAPLQKPNAKAQLVAAGALSAQILELLGTPIPPHPGRSVLPQVWTAIPARQVPAEVQHVRLCKTTAGPVHRDHPAAALVQVGEAEEASTLREHDDNLI